LVEKRREKSKKKSSSLKREKNDKSQKEERRELSLKDCVKGGRGNFLEKGAVDKNLSL